MKALTIKQPWASAILDRSLRKNVENRTWSTDYRGPLLIHAGKSLDHKGEEALIDRFGSIMIAAQSSAPMGAIIGVVDVVDCLEDARTPEDDWDAGGWHWWGCYGLYLANPARFAEPIPYRGSQGIFVVPDRLVEGAIERAEEFQYGR